MHSKSQNIQHSKIELPIHYARYNDLWLRIIAAILVAHFIVMYGVEQSLFEVLLKPIYYIAMSGSIVIALFLMWFVRLVTMGLDKRYDWRQKPVERIGLQALLGFAAPAVLAFLLAFVYFSLRKLNILNTLYLRIDYPMILVLLLLLNLYYLTYYFYMKMRIAERAVPNTLLAVEGGDDQKLSFLVNQSSKNIPVPIDEIAYFFREGEHNFLRTFSEEDYAITQPLDEVQQQLNEKDFFRANRQILVARKACKHFEPLPYNKLELFVAPAYKLSITISQKRNKTFRDWLNI